MKTLVNQDEKIRKMQLEQNYIEPLDDMEKHIWYIDYLRIVATLGVIIIHVSTNKWGSVNLMSNQWNTFCIFDGSVRWSVPIFVMISGALMLEKNVSRHYILKKINHIITSFIFWSFIYAIVELYRWHNIKDSIIQFLIGPEHMWFMFMIVGLYILVPILKVVVNQDRIMKYLLVLSLCFSFILPQVLFLISIFNGTISEILRKMVENMNFYFSLGYVGYFVLGYYLKKRDLSKRSRVVILCLSAIGFIITVTGTFFLSWADGIKNTSFYNYLTINVLFESIGVFVIFKYHFCKPPKKAKKIVRNLANWSFGTYLVHFLIIDFLDAFFGLKILLVHPGLTIVLISFVIAVLSYLLSFVCHQIPGLCKHIV